MVSEIKYPHSDETENSLAPRVPPSASEKWRRRKFLKDAQSGKIDLIEVRRLSCGPGRGTRLMFMTKAWRKKLQSLGRNVGRVQAKRRAVKARNRWRQISREIWRPHSTDRVTLNPALGATEFDQMTLLAMTPHDWQSAAQIEERIDWSRLRACAGRKWLNAPGKRTDVLRRTVLEDRFRRQGLVEREGIGRGRMPDGTFHNGSLVYRLTERGRELKTKLERGETPLRGPPVAQVAFPVGWVPAHRKILCTLVPGAWRAAREIWEAAMPGCTRTEGDNLVTNFAPKLRRAGFIERKENPVGRDLTYLPWTEEYRRNRATPRWFYRLTERGVELRKALLLID